MKQFSRLAFDWARCERELAEFRGLLDQTTALGEREHVLPFFRTRPHLSAFIGTYHPALINRALIAYEYQLFGDFGADLVIGDDQSRAYCFVEFENAVPRSVFANGRRNTPTWSSRFLQGYSQIADWFWRLEDLRRTDEFEQRFGDRSAHFMGILVIGRERFLSPSARARLEWWRRTVRIENASVLCCTYDELCATLERRMAYSRVLASP